MNKRQFLHGGLLSAVALTQARAQGEKPGIFGQKAPVWDADQWFNLPEGVSELNPADYKGKVVYLYCFQSWCPGCHKHGFPTLKTLSTKFRDEKDVVFVAVQTVFEGFSSNTPEKAESMAERYDLAIPIGHSGKEGERSPMMRRYRTGGTPWTVLIDRKGVVRFNDFHISPEGGESAINQLLAEK